MKTVGKDVGRRVDGRKIDLFFCLIEKSKK